jgi:hypothetical protein
VDALERLADFLAWAHPAGAGCGPATGLRLLEEWPGGLRARYTVACGERTRDLEGVFQVRQADAVWQVAGGYEADAARMEATLAGNGAPAGGPAGAPGPPQTAPVAPETAPAGNGPAAPPAGRGETAGGGVIALPPPPENEAPDPSGVPAVRLDPGDASPMRLATPPLILRQVRPAYPEELGRARIIGGAEVEILVDVSAEGRPERVRPLRGPDLDLGVRGAAGEAALRFEFAPARIAGRPVRYFVPVEITFPGLPRDSIHWQHRALFHLEALVSAERGPLEAARQRLEAGKPFEAATAAARDAAYGAGDWGFVSAATLPARVRRALHEAAVGSVVGPVQAEGLHYLMVKRGEIYYGIKPGAGPDLEYQVVHERNGPPAAALRDVIEADLVDYLAESRRQAYVNEAARLMGFRQARFDAGRLLIHTDALDDTELEMLARLVQAAVRAHEELWSPLVPLRPLQQQVLVYALARRADHDRLHRLWHTGPGVRGGERRVGPAGEYIPASRIISIPCEETGGHLPVPTLIHETIHMLDYERVYRAGVRPSQWFEEGVASYHGLSHVGADLRLEPGDIRRSGTLVAGTARLQFDPRAQLRIYHKGIRDSGPVSLSDLLATGAGDPFWTGSRAVRAYSAAWTLVHYLLHGERRRHRDAFLRYAALEARGAGGPDAFARLFGPDLEALEAAWHDYEERL